MAKNEAEKAPKEPKVSSDTEEATAEVSVDTPADEQKDEVPQVVGQGKKKRFAISRFGLVVVVAVVLNLAIGGVSAYLWLHKPKAVSNQPIATAPVQNVQTEAKAPEPETPKTLHYKAEKLGAEFDYPVDWRVQDSADVVQLNSPQAIFKTADGAIFQGRAVISISSAVSYFGDERSSAVFDAERLAYSNPAPGQVPKTYASFFKLYDRGDLNFFDIILVGGSLNYRSGQKLTEKNYKASNPFIQIYVEEYPHHQAFVTAKLTQEAWRDNSYLQQVKAVITSMRFN